MLLMLNSCRQKICINLIKKEKCIHIQMYICRKSIILGGAKYDKGDTKFDSYLCHILHPHTLFEGCKI